MAKHSKKRQRVKSEKEPQQVAPLGTKVYGILDENEKDDEERQLEKLLFGKFTVAEAAVDTDHQENTAGGGLANLLDSDVRGLFSFFLCSEDFLFTLPLAIRHRR